MAHKDLDSSMIASASYDDDRKVLEIRFRTARVYQYREVPRGVYEELIASDSAGKYFNEVIRNGYDSVLVYDPQRPRVR